ncbi:MAG: glycosyltransferase family 39 protein [Candidatus Dormibacteria bacterium]
MTETSVSAQAQRPRRGLRGRLTPPTYGGRVAAITAAGAVLRLAFLDRQPLWRDEAFTALAVQRSLGGMLDAVRRDSAPPLAYLLDRVVAVVSTSPAALRVLPALAGSAAVPLGAALGRRIGGDRTGLLAGAACALSPALVLSARDARMYALATTLVMVATLLLWRAVERPTVGRWALYAGAVAAALHTQYFAAFGVAGQLLAVLLVLRPSPRTMASAVISATAGGLTLVPWMLSARSQLLHGSTPFWVESVGAKTVSSVVLQFLSGPPIDAGTPGRVTLQTMQALASGVGGMALYALVRQRRNLSPPGRRAAAFLGASGLGAACLFIVASLWHPLVEARYVSVVWGPLVPLLGAGLSLMRCRALTGFAMASLAAVAATLSLAVTHPDAPAVADQLRGRVGAHDIVAVDPDTYLLLQYYAAPEYRARIHVLADSVPWFWGTAVYPDGAVIPEVPTDVTDHGGTIHRVVEASGGNERPPPRGYGLADRSCRGDLCLERYRPLPSS